MKIELMYHDNEVVGYKLIKEETDCANAIGIIRDMCFFGMDGQRVDYNGRESDADGEIAALRFCTREHAEYLRNKRHGNI